MMKTASMSIEALPNNRWRVSIENNDKKMGLSLWGIEECAQIKSGIASYSHRKEHILQDEFLILWMT